MVESPKGLKNPNIKRKGSDLPSEYFFIVLIPSKGKKCLSICSIAQQSSKTTPTKYYFNVLYYFNEI